MRIARVPIIVALELLGGAWAIVGGIATWSLRPAGNGWPCALLIGGGLLSVCAGYLLGRGRAQGVRLSFVVQGIQLVQLVVPKFAFVMVLGPSVVVGLVGNQLGFRAAIEEQALLRFGFDGVPLRIEANLLAIACLLALRGIPHSPAPTIVAVDVEVSAV